MSELQVGDTLEFTEEQAVALKAIFKRIDILNAGVDLATEKYAKARHEAWDFVRSTAPESQGFGMNYNKETGLVTLTSREGLHERLERDFQRDQLDGPDTIDVLYRMLYKSLAKMGHHTEAVDVMKIIHGLEAKTEED
jgi:hypothetical protein